MPDIDGTFIDGTSATIDGDIIEFDNSYYNFIRKKEEEAEKKIKPKANKEGYI